MQPLSPGTTKQRKPRKPNHPCRVCKDDTCFTHVCIQCGFSICLTCMNDNMERLKCNGRWWTCPACKKGQSL